MTTRLRSGGATDVGRVREINEDRFLIEDERLFAVAEDKQQVYVRAVIQFVPAQLAQSQDGKRCIDQAAQGIQMLRRAVATLQFAIRLAQSFLDDEDISPIVFDQQNAGPLPIGPRLFAAGLGER